MHPLVPFLMGEAHPAGNRLVNVQKCLRTDDIDNVGDGFHHTFFLMLGNWSLGDYFKDEAIAMSFEFLTSPDWLGINPQKLYVSVFAGDEDAPRDEESIEFWQREFKKAGVKAGVKMPKEVGPSKGSNLPEGKPRIFLFGKKENWWGPVGKTGPCGPCTEIFYNTGKKPCGPNCDPSCSCGRYIEIWNNVFMEYKKKVKSEKLKVKSYEYTPLKQKNVDTGMGVARVVAVTSGFDDDDYQTELFRPIIKKIEKLSGRKYPWKKPAKEKSRQGKESDSLRRKESDSEELPDSGESAPTRRSMRIITDHLRAATFAIADGVTPSNVDRGYIVRRLIRRAIRHGHLLGIEKPFSTEIAQVIIENYKDLYPELKEQESIILKELEAEEKQFGRTLKRGLREFDKLVNRKLQKEPPIPQRPNSPESDSSLCEESDSFPSGAFPRRLSENSNPKELSTAQISGEEAFDLYQTYGFPLELTEEMARERGLSVDREGFDKAFKKHQEKSRAGLEKKFTGGLADHSEIVTRYHTATHLLHTALRQVLGEHIQQKGSNITPERLRFDFSHPEKMTEEELKQIENIVNQKIAQDLSTKMETMSLEEAKKQGALAFFAQKYGDQVKVYTIVDPSDPRGFFSKEVCGGPHVKSTGELGKFQIIKEKSVSRGVRRIRAVLRQLSNQARIE